MMKRLSVGVLTLLVLLASASAVLAQDEPSPSPSETPEPSPTPPTTPSPQPTPPPIKPPTTPARWNIEYTLFLPSAVIVSWDVWTPSASYRNITVAGYGNYRITTTRNNMRFECLDADVYGFTIEISYNMSIEQTIAITIMSGSKGVIAKNNYLVNTDRIIIYFSLRTEKEPVYPTKEEIITGIVNSTRQWLQEIERKSMVTVNYQNYLLAFLTALILVVLVLCGVFLKIVSPLVKRREV